MKPLCSLIQSDKIWKTSQYFLIILWEMNNLLFFSYAVLVTFQVNIRNVDLLLALKECL